MTRPSIVAAVLTAMLAGCTAASSPQTVTPSFAGWVPTPSRELMAYADCLKAQDVPVDDVVGAFVLVANTAEAAAARAREACENELEAYHDTVLSNASRNIPNEAAYRFIHQVRNCLIKRYQVTLKAEQTLLVLGEPGITQSQFQACVDEIRAFPTPST